VEQEGLGSTKGDSALLTSVPNVQVSPVEMSLHAPLGSKVGLAAWTLEGPFTLVQRESMLFEVRGVAEPSPAVSTLVRMCDFVGPFVGAQSTLEGEGRRAQVAEEGSLRRVNPHVDCEG